VSARRPAADPGIRPRRRPPSTFRTRAWAAALALLVGACGGATARGPAADGDTRESQGGPGAGGEGESPSPELIRRPLPVRGVTEVALFIAGGSARHGTSATLAAWWLAEGAGRGARGEAHPTALSLRRTCTPGTLATCLDTLRRARSDPGAVPPETFRKLIASLRMARRARDASPEGLAGALAVEAVVGGPDPAGRVLPLGPVAGSAPEEPGAPGGEQATEPPGRVAAEPTPTDLRETLAVLRRAPAVLVVAGDLTTFPPHRPAARATSRPAGRVPGSNPEASRRRETGASGSPAGSEPSLPPGEGPTTATAPSAALALRTEARLDGGAAGRLALALRHRDPALLRGVLGKLVEADRRAGALGALRRFPERPGRSVQAFDAGAIAVVPLEHVDRPAEAAAWLEALGRHWGTWEAEGPPPGLPPDPGGRSLDEWVDAEGLAWAAGRTEGDPAASRSLPPSSALPAIGIGWVRPGRPVDGVGGAGEEDTGEDATDGLTPLRRVFEEARAWARSPLAAAATVEQDPSADPEAAAAVSRLGSWTVEVQRLPPGSRSVLALAVDGGAADLPGRWWAAPTLDAEARATAVRRNAPGAEVVPLVSAGNRGWVAVGRSVDEHLTELLHAGWPRPAAGLVQAVRNAAWSGPGVSSPVPGLLDWVAGAVAPGAPGRALAAAPRESWAGLEPAAVAALPADRHRLVWLTPGQPREALARLLRRLPTPAGAEGEGEGASAPSRPPPAGPAPAASAPPPAPPVVLRFGRTGGPTGAWHRLTLVRASLRPEESPGARLAGEAFARVLAAALTEAGLGPTRWLGGGALDGWAWSGAVHRVATPARSLEGGGALPPIPAARVARAVAEGLQDRASSWARSVDRAVALVTEPRRPHPEQDPEAHAPRVGQVAERLRQASGAPPGLLPAVPIGPD